jgi:hypothetical protein
MCEDCEKKWAESIFEDDEFRGKILEDFEVQHFCDGTFRFNSVIATDFAKFLKEQADEQGQWEEDSSEEEKIESVTGVVHRLLDIVGESQQHLAKFSLN